MQTLLTRPARTAAAVTLCAGLALTQQACADGASDGAPSASPSAATSAPTTGAPATTTPATPSTSTPSASTPGSSAGGESPILRGERQVVIKPLTSFESIVAVDDKGRLNLTDGEAEFALFVFVPVGGGRHQIKTAKASSGGEPSCMGLRANGSNPSTVVATACDTAAKGQLFSVRRTSTTDEGRPTYTISGAGDVHLRTTRDGLVAQRVDAPGEDAIFTFVDNGPAKLPELD